MIERCDVAIVGARCAGAALATFLARRGVSVVVVDKSKLPSEHVLSTHTVHPSGMAMMDELGLGDAVRRHSPEMRTIRFDWQGAALDLTLPRGHGEHCPRRKRFDGLLQDAAREAGATLLERTTARALIYTAGRVAGVELEGPDGARTTLHARIVVGADGRNSRLASWLNAEEYLGYEAPRGMYWGYFRAPPGWGASADPLGALRAALVVDPMLRDAVSQAPLELVRGYLRERYFVRRAAGPGWLLLGDAALHKEISEARPARATRDARPRETPRATRRARARRRHVTPLD